MRKLTFDSLFQEVVSYWPDKIADLDGSPSTHYSHSSSFRFHSEHVEPRVAESGSMLVSQIDWILFGIINDLSKILVSVRPREVRRELVKAKFDELIRTVALPQIRGEQEFDGSFDKVELESYLRSEMPFDV